MSPFKKPYAAAVAAIDAASSGAREELDLSGLELKDLPPITGNLTALRRLTLGGNRLTELPSEIWQLENLEHLDVGSNRLRQLGPGVGNLVRLTSLDLSENRLTTLPGELANCLHLSELDLFDNRLPVLPTAVLSLASLVRLDLARNRLETLPELRDRFPQLEKLDLSGNRIVRLPTTFGTLPILRVLNLSANQIESIDELVTLIQLEELYVDENALKSIPTALIDLPFIRLMSMNGNPLGALPAGLDHLLSAARPRRVGPPLQELVFGGATPGKKYFAEPQSVFGFSVALKDPAAVLQSLDYYYKEFAGTPVSLKFSDGLTLDLAALGRKTAFQIAEERRGAALTGAVLTFRPTNEQVEIRRNCEFAERTTVRVPGADLIESKFYFVLRGDYAQAAAICAYHHATLEFRYEPPPSDVLRVVEGKRLEEARKADLDITLQLSVRGQLEIVGDWTATAKFHDAAMIEPVTFTIEAGSATGATSWIHVDFLVKGEMVYQSELAIMVVATQQELSLFDRSAAMQPAAPQLTMLDESQTIEPPPPHRIELSLNFRQGNFCIDLRHLKDGLEVRKLSCNSSGIDRSTLEALIELVRGDLVPCYENEAFWASFDGKLPLSDVSRLSLSRTLATVAAAGWRLNASLRADSELAKALDYVQNEAPDGAVLTILTDVVFLPWELLYPHFRSTNMTAAQKLKSPIKPGEFWGARFAIETVQRRCNCSPSSWRQAQIQVASLRRTHIEALPKVSINLNPTIEAEAKKGDPDAQPITMQQKWATRLKNVGLLDGRQEKCDDIRHILQECDNNATLIYVYCHGSSPNPFGGKGEFLDLDDNCPLTPGDLSDDSRYRAAPIVFLNSCQSGIYSPLTFSSFLTEFRRRGALGMIATSYSIPMVFGAHFGEEVVDCYLQRSGSLTIAIHMLRRRHLLEYGNPVPLFYSLQCQLTFPSARGTEGS